jgi:Glycoside hydrolase 123, catalytic domain
MKSLMSIALLAAFVSSAAEITNSALNDPRPGYWLAQTKNLGVWWCESGWKIGRDRVMPQKSGHSTRKRVAVSAAEGEYEAVQLVLHPERDGQLLSAEVSPLHRHGQRAADIALQIDEVAYVEVVKPTDKTCAPGWYPDPLPPLRTPLALHAGMNQPLWITFHVSRSTAGGDYTTRLILKTTLGDVRVPVLVHVYDFTLPEESHLRSALGMGSGEINRYHRLSRPEDKEAVFQKYLTNFAEHRISPYSFFDYAPIDIRFVGEGTNQHAQVDFSKFDRAAAKWLDEHHFNSFRLPLRGMGGGTFHSRHLGELEGFKEGTPEHARLFHDYLSQIERHLLEHGWLDKAYTYWFDEPDRKDYEFVTDGMKRIKAAAPGIKRMLTEQPEPALMGNVDIWCALTPEWTPEKVRARREAGEEVWWYICTGPKAPYLTEFIDHAGTELRLWPWQSWQYGVQGILIWATLYWNSPVAYPAPQLQNPWRDPMSWRTGYGTPIGQKKPWGNGDGRFLYPPRRDPNTAQTPCMDGPINSLRWENLRDGMEDYEYFWLLQRQVERVSALKGENRPVREARALLKVPADISQDLTHFTTDPRLILQQRDRIARMIERLRKIR